MNNKLTTHRIFETDDNGVQTGRFKVETKLGDTLVSVVDYNKNNRIDGKYIIYFQDGSVKIEETFKEDNRDGESLYYFPNGNLEKLITYDNGVQSGLFASFSEDGEIISCLVKYKNGDTADIAIAGNIDDFMKAKNEIVSAVNVGVVPSYNQENLSYHPV